jgi:hypothetical protein
MVRTQDVYDYLGIDYADDMVAANVSRAVSAANAYLEGAVGYDYPTDDPRAKELILILVADLYNNRGSTEKSSTNIRRFVTDSLLQLRLELRRTNE